MKKIRKNQIIITSLAVLIAVAGYVSYSKFDFGKADVQYEAVDAENVVGDINSLDYDLTEETANAQTGDSTPAQEKAADESAVIDESASQTKETAAAEGMDGKKAEMTSADDASTETGSGTPGEAVLTGASTFAAQAKISREQVRAQNKETLLSVINNTALTDEEKQAAVASMVQMTELMEKEEAAEALLESKGFTDVVVNLTGETADVCVPSAYLDDASRAQIEDAVKSKAEVAGASIVITPINTTEE